MHGFVTRHADWPIDKMLFVNFGMRRRRGAAPHPQ
jgi:hypothetical protein